jgi:Tfp pilus assembly protein PilF
MLCMLPNAEKPGERSRFLPKLLPQIFFLIFLNSAFIGGTPLVGAQAPDSENVQGRIAGIALSQGDNRPVGHLPISLKSSGAGIFRSILTDIEGHFEVRGLPAGTYDLEVDDAGYEPVRTKVQVDSSSPKLVLYLKSTIPVGVHRSGSLISIRQLKIPGKAQNEYQKGLQSLQKNKLNEGLEHFRKAVTAFSGYYEAQYHIGVAELRLGQKHEAMQAFQRAVELSGGRYARAEYGIAVLLCEEGNKGEAEALIRRGLDADNSLPEGYSLLGVVLVLENHMDEAEKSARQALLRDANFPEAHLVLSDVYASRGDSSAQLRELETFLALEPHGPQSDRVRLMRELARRNLPKLLPQD